MTSCVERLLPHDRRRRTALARRFLRALDDSATVTVRQPLGNTSVSAGGILG